MEHLNPRDCREEHGVYSNSPAYQNLSDSQKMIFDYAEENGIRGSKRRSAEEIARWKEKRAKMTPEELEEMKQKDELDKWTGKWMLIGFGIFLAVVCTILIVGEMTGNSLTENFTGVFGVNN